MSAIRRILERAQPGSSGGVTQHIRRGERLAELIRERWQVERPEQWRAKHVRWALERGLSERSAASRYDYYRTVRVIAAALGHWPDWEPHLIGSWIRPTGERGAMKAGRPPKLSLRARAARTHGRRASD